MAHYAQPGEQRPFSRMPLEKAVPHLTSFNDDKGGNISEARTEDIYKDTLREHAQRDAAWLPPSPIPLDFFSFCKGNQVHSADPHPPRGSGILPGVQGETESRMEPRSLRLHLFKVI